MVVSGRLFLILAVVQLGFDDEPEGEDFSGLRGHRAGGGHRMKAALIRNRSTSRVATERFFILDRRRGPTACLYDAWAQASQAGRCLPEVASQADRSGNLSLLNDFLGIVDERVM